MGIIPPFVQFALSLLIVIEDVRSWLILAPSAMLAFCFCVSLS